MELRMKTCLLIMTHGSRATEYGLEFSKLLDELNGRNLYDDVRGCYLQFQEPSLHEAARSLAEAGFDYIVLVPYFLFQGFHTQNDIPAVLREVEKDFPSVRFSVAKPLGFDPLLADIVLARASDARLVVAGD